MSWDPLLQRSRSVAGQTVMCRLSPPCALGRAHWHAVASLDSPDGRWSLFEETGNLVVRSTVGEPSISLTSGGRDDHGFGIRPGARATAGVRSGADLPPVAVWAPDSRRLVVHRLDERRVGTMPLVDHVDGDGHRRPREFSYRLALAGDRELPTAELWLIDIAGGDAILVDLPAQELLWLTPIELGRVWWSEDCSAVYVITSDRGERAVELHEVDISTGSTRRILREENATFIELNLDIGRPPNVHVLPGGRELVWFSERSGWAHLQLHDTETGDLIGPITEGAWVVRDVIRVDAARRLVWFTASGREADRDPYQRYLYVVGLDGGDPVLLTPEDADHEISIEAAEDDWRIVDEYARIGQPTVCVVRDRDTGAVVETRWERPPEPSTAERFTVVARDGVTPLYGVMFRPSDFDPDRRYPVIDNIYGFPQTIQTPKRSAAGPWQALADSGFVVLVLDGLGTAFRSKTFHDASYGRLEDATLPDHVTALHQLAERYPWLDLNRVGIYGSSVGGPRPSGPCWNIRTRSTSASPSPVAMTNETPSPTTSRSTKARTQRRGPPPMSPPWPQGSGATSS